MFEQHLLGMEHKSLFKHTVHSLTISVTQIWIELG